jgi:hypothetical protein
MIPPVLRIFFGSFFSSSCPYCKSIDFESVGTKNGFERSLGWLLHPYRCSLCGRRFCVVRSPPAIGEAT